MTGLPEGLYDATAPTPSTSGEHLLQRAQEIDATQRLEAALSRVSEHVALAREEDLRDGLDEATLALLDGLSGGRDAPLEWRSLHARVASGRTSWERVWADPGAEAGGRRLVLAVVSAQAAAGVEARARFGESSAHGA